MEPRLKAEIWVKAYLRACEAQGAAVAIVRRGDTDAGAVLLKVNRLDGTAEVLSRATRGDGTRVWLRVTGELPAKETDADAYLARAVSKDPDIWIVEIEDRQGRHFLTEPVD